MGSALAILLFVLLIVMLVGHGMWVLLAFVLRALTSRGERRGFEPTLHDDRNAAARYLHDLNRRGILDDATHARMMRFIAQDDRGEYPSRELSDEFVAVHHWGGRGPTTEPTTAAAPPRLPEPTEPAPPPSMPAATVPRGQADLEPSLAGAPRDMSTLFSRVTEHRATVEPEVRPQPAVPAEPKRPFSQVLLSFMAEKNIRWGELIGGLLILCCSTALVLSLWSQIESIPVLKFAIFTSVTAALFGVGLFVHHRWRLPTTGHAVLIVSSLLVPLNLLAFAALSSSATEHTVATIGLELASVVLFGWLLLLAGRILVPATAGLFAFGVLGLSAGSLLVRRFPPAGETGVLAMAGGVLAVYAAVMFLAVRRQSPPRRLAEPRVKELFLQLAALTFAGLAPLGLLLLGAGPSWRTAFGFAPVLTTLAVPAFLTGSFIRRRAARDVSAQAHTAALSIALVAAAIMLVGVGMAWPMPGRMIPALLVAASAVFVLSRFARHAAIAASLSAVLALVWLLGAHVGLGGVEWSNRSPADLLHCLFSARTGQALVVPVAACIALAEWLSRRKRRVNAAGHAITGGVFAVVSLLAVVGFGFGRTGDPHYLVGIALFYAAVAFWAAFRFATRTGTVAGCLLVQLAIVQEVVYVWQPGSLPWTTALLLGATVCSIANVLLKWRIDADWVERIYARLLFRAALAFSAAAAVGMSIVLSASNVAGFSGRMFWLAAMWAILAAVNVRPVVFVGAQIAMIAGASGALQHHLNGQAWYQALSSPQYEPSVWIAHLLVISAAVLVYALLRCGVIRRIAAFDDGSAGSPSGPSSGLQRASALLNPSFQPTDRWLAVLALVGLATISAWAVLPPVLVEHGSQHVSAAARARHMNAAGFGTLVLLLTMVPILLVHLWEGRHVWAVSGLLLTVLCSTAVAAARFAPQQSAVGAWRWLLAATFVAASAAWWTRSAWSAALQRRIRPRPVLQPVAPADARIWIAILFAVPAVVLTATFITAAAQGTANVAQGWSDGWLRFSLLGPCVLVALCAFMHGMLDGRARYAAAAAVLVCVVATGVELAIVSRGGGVVSAALLVRLVQLNAGLSALFALGWRFIQPLVAGAAIPADAYPRWLLNIPRAALGLMFAIAILSVWMVPRAIAPGVLVVADPVGWAAVLSLELALLLVGRASTHERDGLGATVCVFFGLSLAAFSLAAFDLANWICFHALLLGSVPAAAARLYLGNLQIVRAVGAGWRETFEAASAVTGPGAAIGHDLSCATCGYNLRGLPAAGLCPECGAAVKTSVETAVGRLEPEYGKRLWRIRIQAISSVLLFVAIGMLFALRGSVDDPQRPWWSAGALLATAGVVMALAAWAPQRMLAYLAGLQACIAVSIWWFIERWNGTPLGLTDWPGFTVVALAGAGLAWLAAERKLLRPRGGVAVPASFLPFHHAAAALGAATVLVTAIIATLVAATGREPSASVAGVGLSWLATFALWVALRRDAMSKHVAAALYALGLAALLQIVARQGLAPSSLATTVCVALAGYVLAVCVVRRIWQHRVSDSTTAAPAWFAFANDFLVVASVLPAFGVSIRDPQLAHRLAVIAGPALLAAAAVLSSAWLAGGLGQAHAAGLGCATLVLAAWAAVSPTTPAPALHRAVGAMSAFMVCILACGVAGRWLAAESSWRAAARRVVSAAIVLGSIALLYCIGVEVSAVAHGESVPMNGVAVAAMIAAIAGLIAAAIAFAVSDRLDPLRLTPAAKERYVYAAEALGAVLALHFRATMPWLFTGFITQYWPVLIMVLAFVGVAAQELCERYGQRVLGRPLGRTGLFLPTMAALELFLAASQVHYSVVLLTVGAFYGILAALRHSIPLAAASGAALNGSLWYLLYHTPGLALTQHPQLWFVPPALGVLAAGHFTRDRLTAAQLRALHYGCLLTVYLSSTADIFLIGVAKAPWLPLVLAGLSVVGIFVGFASRLRSFLMMGTGFLCLSLFTMIWHATSNLGWTWVWYVAGIVLGAGIITVFALFEHKRAEMNAWVEQFKTWGE